MNQIPGAGSIPQDALYADYTQFFEQLGCRLHGVSNFIQDIDGLLDQLAIEGVILSGGNDISTEITGDADRDVRNPAPTRDFLERKLVSAALDRNLPVLGICRGMQFINVYFGGSLTQNIATELPDAGCHIRTDHQVTVVDRPAQQWLQGSLFTVNSYHHQGVQQHQVSPELEIFALSRSDQIVEGVFHPQLPIAGIQWHPERPGNSRRNNIALIEAFLNRRNYWKER